MVNTQLFKTAQGRALPAADTINAAGGLAYQFTPQHQLAQYACTGSLNATFYASAEAQLDTVLQLAAQVDPTFVAKTAIYARQSAYMKDMPALLLATLATKDTALLAQVFGRVIDNGKMLRNFVQILRSGAVGRKSLGTRPKKLVQSWLLNASEAQLLKAAVGNAPSLADVVKMVHPKPIEAWRAAWFAWLIGRPYDASALPPITQAFERFKASLTSPEASVASEDLPLPAVPFQMLTALPLRPAHWVQIAKQGSWQMVRQNLNTFARHGVFEVPGMAAQIARLLSDPLQIQRARVMPYQLLAAYQMTAGEAKRSVPRVVSQALQTAMELALANVPELPGRVAVCPDVSGSMSSPVTGWRAGATTAVRCIDVAALVAAAICRKNPKAQVLPFENHVVDVALKRDDSVLVQAQALAAIGGGGTNCSAPLRWLNDRNQGVDVVIMVSDNESWIDHRRQGASQTMLEWDMIKRASPKARLVCIDLQPNATTQAIERPDVLNVGGFSDAVFEQIATFIQASSSASVTASWVQTIEAISLECQ